MSFDTEARKQAQETIFNKKIQSQNHLAAYFSPKFHHAEKFLNKSLYFSGYLIRFSGAFDK